MKDMQPDEMKVLLDAGRMGGEYLEEIGQSDLAKLSPDQWLEFLKCVVGYYLDNQPPPF